MDGFKKLAKDLCQRVYRADGVVITAEEIIEQALREMHVASTIQAANHCEAELGSGVAQTLGAEIRSMACQPPAMFVLSSSLKSERTACAMGGCSRDTIVLRATTRNSGAS